MLSLSCPEKNFDVLIEGVDRCETIARDGSCAWTKNLGQHVFIHAQVLEHVLVVCLSVLIAREVQPHLVDDFGPLLDPRVPGFGRHILLDPRAQRAAHGRLGETIARAAGLAIHHHVFAQIHGRFGFGNFGHRCADLGQQVAHRLCRHAVAFLRGGQETFAEYRDGFITLVGIDERLPSHLVRFAEAGVEIHAFAVRAGSIKVPPSLRVSSAQTEPSHVIGGVSFRADHGFKLRDAAIDSVDVHWSQW